MEISVLASTTWRLAQPRAGLDASTTCVPDQSSLWPRPPCQLVACGLAGQVCVPREVAAARDPAIAQQISCLLLPSPSTADEAHFPVEAHFLTLPFRPLASAQPGNKTRDE